MKTILKIIAILLAAGIVAGALSLAVDNSSATSSSNNSGQPPIVTSSQSTTQSMVRPEGGERDGGSITQGLAGVAGTLTKLTGISVLVLLFQKGLSQPGKRKLIVTQR